MHKNSIEKLKLKYPETVFVHFTMPVKSLPRGIKVKIKNILGIDIPVQLDNVVRGEYNDLLRNEYAGKEPVFDIAHLESIAPNSQKRYGFSRNNKQYESMAPENTYDGGHLSDVGKRWIAEQLVVFLSSLNYKS